MKTYLQIALALVLLWALPQQAHSQRLLERVQAKKVAFLSNKMELTPEEAKVFWPIYDEFEVKQQAIQQIKLRIFQENKKGERRDNLPDEATQQKLALEYLDTEIDEAKLRKEYYYKFAAVIPVHKIITMYRAEQQFRMQLLNEIKQRNQDRKRLD
ncbi:MAG: hypothetical protein RIS47_1855 [Bacteroidota bacterium]